MKKLYSILMLGFFIKISLFGQIDLSGKYWTHSCGFLHGYFLRLFPDSTAHFTKIFEDADKYLTGKWSQSNDSLIVELDTVGEHFNKYEYFLINDSLTLDKLNKDPYILANRLYRLEAYYPDGGIRYKLNYGYSKDSAYVFDGRLCFYYPQKRLKRIIDYKDGVRDGIEINYYWHGYIQSYGSWVKDKKHGVWLFYDIDFNKIGAERYKKGTLKSKTKSSPCFPGWDLDIYKKLYLDRRENRPTHNKM